MNYARINRCSTGAMIGWLAGLSWSLLSWQWWAVMLGWLVVSMFLDIADDRALSTSNRVEKS